MRNIDVAHRFFYQENEQFNKNYMSVGFNGDIFYSYYTAIARKIKGRQGQNILLLSDSKFSNTTAKHIQELWQACPSNYTIIYVPQIYGSYHLELDTIIERIKNNITVASTFNMSLKVNRENFSKYYTMLIRLNIFVCDIDKKLIKKYTPLYDIINDPVKLKELKATQQQKAKQSQEKLKRKLNKILNKYSYMDLIQFTYANAWFKYWDAEVVFKEVELKTQLKKYFNPRNRLAFIWFGKKYAITSAGTHVNKEEAETALKLWANGELKQGMQVDGYTVREVTPKYVQVGCHKIPTTNLQALYNEMLKAQKAA